MNRQITALEIIDQVVACSTAPDGSIQRLLYTDSWLAAQRRLREIMEAQGLVTRLDSVGNLLGRVEGIDSQTVLTGSHMDTVRNGGRLDGLYGIAGGIEAVARLVARYGKPRRSLEVVAFAEEEGSRFPYNFWGSKSLMGLADRREALTLLDADRLSLGDEMARCGLPPETASPPGRTDIAAFVELHIEQGAVLEREGAEIGVVEAIVGQKRFSVKVLGAANHAGTTPMKYRRDALACAAEIIAGIHGAALAGPEPLVATVGQIGVLPGSGNVIASQAEFSVDIRHTDGEQLGRFEARVLAMAQAAAARHGTRLEISSRQLDAAPVHMDAAMVSRIEAACRGVGLRYLRMPSGAGHDAQIMAGLVPTGMIFVPSRDGVSHSPLEYTAPESLAAGVRVLADTLYGLCYAET